MLGEEAAENRTAQAGCYEDACDIDLVAPAFSRRNDIGDDRLREGNQSAAADTLQTAGANQDEHRRRQSAGDGTDNKSRDRREKDGAAAVNVAEFAVERRHRSRG